MAHRAIAAALAIGGILILPSRPLIALIVFGALVVVVLNARGAFGSGMHRAILAFVSALWLALVGTVATLLGLIPPAPAGSFLLVPGLILLGCAASLLVGSLVAMLRSRRPRRPWPGEVRSGRSR